MVKPIRLDDSGDSADLQSLFDSIAGGAAPAVLFAEPDPSGDSADLQALFDRVSEQVAESAAAASADKGKRMGDFAEIEDLLQDFLVEATDLLSGVENKLVALEINPQDHGLLNDIFVGFHTIKGGADFLDASELVTLCQLTENLFDKLRNGEMAITGEMMDVVLAVTAAVREMFGHLGCGVQPPAADAALIANLQAALAGQLTVVAAPATEPDWNALFGAVVGTPVDAIACDNTIRVDTARLDRVLNLSGEIGLTKNRLMALRSDILNGCNDSETLPALDQAVSQLDLLVSDLQNAVVKTRMQPIGQLFRNFPRFVRDLARNLGKDVDLVLVGEETEIDKTMSEALSAPLAQLIRNAVGQGIESPQERLACGKPEKAQLRLEARQEGGHVVLVITDDGHGMNADMDVVKTNIQKLNGDIETKSQVGEGTSFIISLPQTLATLPVLLVKLGEQPFAVPLSMVREILPIHVDQVQEVGGRATMVVHDEVMPIYPISHLLGWAPERVPDYGVLMQTGDITFILAIDGFMGREDALFKSLADFRPKGVAGVTSLSNGQIVLILDMKELFADLGENCGVPRSAFIPEQQAAA